MSDRVSRLKREKEGKRRTFGKQEQETTAQKTRFFFISWVANIFLAFSQFFPQRNQCAEMRIKKRFFSTAFQGVWKFIPLRTCFRLCTTCTNPPFFREKNMLDLTRRGKSFGGRKKEGKRFLITRLLIPFPLKSFFLWKRRGFFASAQTKNVGE